MASPGLNEITTTTLRTKPMKFVKGGESPNAKASAKAVATTGTHAPEKDTSPKAKIAKAAGPAAVVASDSAPDPKSWEGSHEDWTSDYNASKRKGMTTEQWEGSAGDRISDAAGERRMKADGSKEPQGEPGYKKGVGAFSNAPKTSSGFGHPASACSGHLRNSGHSGAHRLGGKKK